MARAEKRSYGERGTADIERRGGKLEREKTRGREKMPKKEISGGEEEEIEQDEASKRGRENMARAQGIAIWGSRGIC